MTANTALEAESVVKLGRRYGLRLVIAGAFGVEDFAQEIMDQGRISSRVRSRLA